MSIINEWVAGQAASVAALTHDGSSAGVRSYEFGGMTDLDVSTLFAIVAGEQFDFDKHELMPLEDDTEAEIYPLPERFVQLMAQLSDADLARARSAWAQTEELDCEPAQVSAVIQQLREFARTLQAGETLFLTVQ